MPAFLHATDAKQPAEARLLLPRQAGQVIKGYSPDLIVHRIIKEDGNADELHKELEGLLSRLHIIVVGPGLGREPYMQSAARDAITLAKKNNQYIVIDADGLFLVTQEPEIIKGYRRAVLTPNVVEFSRLCEKMGIKPDDDPDTLAKQLASALGNVTVLQKGKVDIMSNGEEVLKCDLPGGLKRSGGQGDVLSGSVGCLLAWAKAYEEGVGKDSGESPIPADRLPLLAAYGGSCVARFCSNRAFAKEGRAMQASDMLQQVGNAYKHYFEDAKL
jgi:ATP-dependent NAD(P)H-hydrate dehydratase